LNLLHGFLAALVVGRWAHHWLDVGAGSSSPVPRRRCLGADASWGKSDDTGLPAAG
jgi:hypothetical protein